MNLRIFALEPPHGRCLLLAQKLQQATSMPGRECLALADRIFASVHKRDNAALVEVSDLSKADELITLCAEFGISAALSEKS